MWSFSCVSCVDAPCSELQGMMSGLLPDSQILASSMRDIHGSMGAARLVASRSGWFPNPTQPIAGEEWIQASHVVPFCNTVFLGTHGHRDMGKVVG